MSVESVGEQWRKAVALGWSMTDEEKGLEADRIKLNADAKFHQDIARGKISSLDSLIETEKILAVFRRLHDRQSPNLSQTEVLTVKELVSV